MKRRMRALAPLAIVSVVVAFESVGGGGAAVPTIGTTPDASADDILTKAGGISDKLPPLAKLSPGERSSVESRSDVACPGQAECGP